MDIMYYGLREKYEQLKKFGDKLSDMKDIIDWDRIKPLLSELYKNDTENGGRTIFDPISMIKIMFLQSLYGLVDEAMEIELYSNIRFMNFLDYPESVPNARARSSKDGTWAVKNKKAHYRHKLHTSQIIEHDIIANYAVTTASVHDSQIDLSILGIVNYKDKGYFGVEEREIDATMDRSMRGYRLPVESIRRNMRITRKRSIVERPYSVIKTEMFI